FLLGQGCHTVIPLHAAKRGVVSGLTKSASGKILILHLRLLQTHHIGLVRRDPIEHQRQAPANGVDVIAGDLHGSSRSSSVGRGGCSCRNVSRYARTLSRGKTSPRSKSISSRFTSCMISHRSPTASRGTTTRKLSVASRQVA